MDGHIPVVGDYFIDSEEIGKDWENKMYIVRAVTHFLNNLVSLHVERYNVDEETKKWEETAEKLRELLRRTDNASEK